MPHYGDVSGGITEARDWAPAILMEPADGLVGGGGKECYGKGDLKLDFEED